MFAQDLVGGIAEQVFHLLVSESETPLFVEYINKIRAAFY
jgi:hypothetical protein